MKKPILLDILYVLFAILFVYAAFMKLADHNLFEAQIGKSPLILEHASWLSWFVPIIELAIAAALFIPKTQLLGLYSFFFMMFLFTGYITFLLTFSPYVPCSCGGVLSTMGWTEHLIFNAIFTGLSVFSIALYNGRTNSSIDIISSSTT